MESTPKPHSTSRSPPLLFSHCEERPGCDVGWFQTAIKHGAVVPCPPGRVRFVEVTEAVGPSDCFLGCRATRATGYFLSLSAGTCPWTIIVTRQASVISPPLPSRAQNAERRHKSCGDVTGSHIASCCFNILATKHLPSAR